MGKSNNKILTFKGSLMYGLGILGIQLFIGMINSFQSQFYTSVFGANLMICAVIILVSKLISSIADPIIGNIIDKSNFKSGKMMPFIKMSALPLAMLTTIMFIAIDFKNDALMYTYITVTSVLWNIAMSFADIPSQGLLALLSPHSEERSPAAAISNLMKSLSLSLPSVIVPIVCIFTGSSAITKKEYFISALVIDGIGLLMYLCIIKGTKEVVKSEPQHMSMKDMFSELKTNKMLLIIFLMNMLGFARNIGMSIGIQTAAVLFDKIDTTVLGIRIALQGENLSVVLGIMCALGSMISIIFVPFVNSKLGEKKTYLVFGIYGTIVSVIAVYLFVCKGGIFRSFAAIMIYQFLVGFMTGTHGFSPMVMLSDTVDYREMQTGKRTEGIQYSVLSLSIKLSNALSVATGIFIVGLSGYQGTMAFADITESMRNIIVMAYWLLPGISVFLSCIPVLFYKIDKNVKKEIVEYKKQKGIIE